MKLATYLHSHVWPYRNLAAFLIFSLGLIFWRVFYTGSITYIFLVWNLFLAFIPFVISELCISPAKSPWSWQNFLAIGACIVFLPNAPYLVTDLFHLRFHREPSIWYDTVLIASSALNGMLLFFHTLRNIDRKILRKLGAHYAWLIKALVITLCGFGIYLGRYLRFNSWDILTNPFTLFGDIIHLVINPFQNPLAWGMTILYALFLGFFYLNFINLRAPGSQEKL